eukprot:TRINITY_DN2885_c0_g1_i1.p1 TRINITY_DN2885_c0_g1~~TRINITY_DN2885_c0_g1_i1.p1  ORF type:complete len:300 (+),score=86.89 TRINITY_DN2885_c0_g1_i1:40-939(+)
MNQYHDERWKDIFFIGTEWHNYSKLFVEDWDFDHLEDYIAENLEGEKLWMFGLSEAILVKKENFNYEDEECDSDMVFVPIIVIVKCDVMPSDLVSLTSVQMASEEIIPMRKLKLKWIPYISEDYAGNRIGSFDVNIRYMTCVQRKTALNAMNKIKKLEYEYAQPYVFAPLRNPFKPPLDARHEMTIDGKTIDVDFSLEFDTPDALAEELIKENNWQDSEALSNQVYESVMQSFEKQVQIATEAQEKFEEKLNSLSPMVRQSIDNMKIIKCYPRHASIDVSKETSSFINNYYSHADEVIA